MWVGVPRNKHDFRNQVMKDAGRQVALGHGYCFFFDIGSNEYRHPEAMKIISKLRRISDRVAAESANNRFIPGGLDAGLLNNIAAASGVYTVSSLGLYSEVNDFFMRLHGCRSGKYTIRLPRKVKCVRDAWSGRVIGRNCSETVLDIIAGKSVWLLLE